MSKVCVAIVIYYLCAVNFVIAVGVDEMPGYGLAW